MKNRRKPDSFHLSQLALMPPLYHTLPDHEFSFDKSQVLNFIRNNEQAVMRIFTLAVNAKLIAYDSQSHMWYGTSYSSATDSIHISEEV